MRRPTNRFAAFESMRNDYRMAKQSRFRPTLRGVDRAGSGADYHFRSEAEWLYTIELARHMMRDDPIVGQAVRRLVANVLQDGFVLDVNTGSTEADKILAEDWYTWSTEPDLCHSEGEFTWQQIERLVLEAIIADGDHIVLPRREGHLQLIEAHRMRTPRNTRLPVVHGILLDRDARRQQYWITREDLGLTGVLAKVADVEKYDARDSEGNRQVFHVYDPRRVSQRRGVSAFAPISDLAGMHDDVQFATVVKAQANACATILRERSMDFVPPDNAVTLGNGTTEYLPGGQTRTLDSLSPGMEIGGLPGEKLSGWTPNIPNPEFFPHVKMILTLISINLDLPVAVLLLDPSQTNFSGWRGAIDQARYRFSQIQAWLAAALHRHVYRWRVRRLLSLNERLARLVDKATNIFGHEWIAPKWAYIEPLKDRTARLVAVRTAQTSNRRAAAEVGDDWEDLAQEIVDDNALAIKLAKKKAAEINAEFPDDPNPVSWRELMPLPTPEGIQIALNTADPAWPPSDREGAANAA